MSVNLKKNDKVKLVAKSKLGCGEFMYARVHVKTAGAMNSQSKTLRESTLS